MSLRRAARASQMSSVVMAEDDRDPRTAHLRLSIPANAGGTWTPVRSTERAHREVGARLEAVARAQRLTARQGQILLLLVCGLSNKEIADRLCCSEVTVEAHMTTLLRRTRSCSRTVLVAKFWLELDVA